MSDSTPSRSSRTTGIAIGLAVVAAAGVGLHFLSSDPPPGPPPTIVDPTAPPPGPAPSVTGPWRVVVLPFAATGSVDADVGDALAQALRATLSLADEVDALDADGPETGAATWTDGAAAARDLDATHFVLGRIEGGADGLRVHAALHHHAGAIVRDVELRSSSDELLTKTRELGLGLLDEGAELPAADTDRAYASSSRSLAAMRAFVRGRRAAAQGEDGAAAEAFAEALAADRAFALAAFRRAEALERSGTIELATEAVELALRNRDRLGSAELGRAEALLAEWRGDYARAVPLLRAHTTAHPSDLDGWLRLGDVLARLGPVRGRPPADGRAAFERALELEPAQPLALERLMELAADAGDLEALAALVERVPEDARPPFALVLAIARSEEPAIRALADAGVVPARGPLLALPGLTGHAYLASRSEDEAALWQAEHDLAHGRPAAAMDRLAERWSTLPPFEVERLAGLLLLPPLRVDDAALAAACPRWSEASTAIAEVDDPHAAVRPLVRRYLAGACAQRLGRAADATAAIADIRAEGGPHAAIGARLADELEAWAALDRGDAARAIELASGPAPAIPAWQVERSPILALALGRWVRVEAAIRQEDWGAALACAESLPHPRGASRALAAVSLHRIAEIYDGAERTVEAATAGERYLGYRDGSEPAFASEVTAVRRRLAEREAEAEAAEDAAAEAAAEPAAEAAEEAPEP